MRRTLLIAAGVALAAVAAALLYTTLARESKYRRLIAEGEAAAAADQTFVAVEAFSGAIVLKPDSMLAHLLRGQTYRRRGELQAALRDLRRAAELDPAAPRPREEIGDVNVALERYERAAESYEAYLRLDDASANVFYKLGLARFRQGNSAGALQALARALALNDRFAEAYYVQGMCHAQMGQQSEAVTALEQALRLAPTLAPAREELVRLLLLLKREPEAITHLEALAALEPTRPDHLIQAGLVYGKLGRTDLAIAELNRAAERDPQPRVYQAFGRIWLEAAENRRDRVAVSKAMEALDRGVRGPGATSEGLTLYGRALELLGDLAGAQAAFEQAIEKTPIDPDAYRRLGSVAERRGEPTLAYDALVRYVAVAPQGSEEPALLEHLGDLATRQGRSTDAVTWFRRASDATEDPDSAARLARAQLAAGDREGALASIDRGLQRAPAHAGLLSLRRLTQIQN